MASDDHVVKETHSYNPRGPRQLHSRTPVRLARRRVARRMIVRDGKRSPVVPEYRV